MRFARAKCAVAAFIIFFAIAEFSGSVVAAAANEYQIKAAFIYKFCLYIEWPTQAFADANAPLIVGVAGPVEMVKELREVTQGRNIAGHPLTVMPVGDADPGILHVLYVTTPVVPGARKLIARVHGTPTLVITETTDSPIAGSVINFTTQENRVRFDIDLDAAAQQGLHMGAQLLQVARTVQAAQPAARGNAP